MIQAQVLPRLGTSIFSGLFNWTWKMKQRCWLPQKINWIEAHLTKVMVLLGTGIFDSPRSFLTCLYSEMLTYAGLWLNGEGNGKSLLSQLGYEFQSRWALVKSLHSPQSWTFPQGASPFPPLSSWGLQFLNRTERARGFWSQEVKD